MSSKHPLSQFCQALKAHDNYLLACHISPEGDAIGSLFAMDSLLRRLGKKSTVAAEESFPKRLRCLSSERWKRIPEIKQRHFEALVVTDCPTLERIGKVRNLINPKTVIFNIDHHISNELFGHYNYVRPEAAASGEVVYDIFKQMEIPFTREDATNLYVALSTDTGSFKFGNTTVHSHIMAAELIASGINLEKINEELYATYSLNKIKLYSRLLSQVKTQARGRIAWVSMRRQDLKHSGATDEDTEGFIDFLKYLKEVQIAFFLIEQPDGSGIRVSFRSKGSHDVNKIATFFNGGGHKKASGCTLQTSLAEAEKIILKRLKKEF